MNKAYKLRLKPLAWAVMVVASFSLSTVHAAKNAKPIVNAGSDQTVAAGDVVNLAGTASDPEGGLLSYSWIYPSKKVSGVNITNANTLSPSFVAPDTTKTIQVQLAFTAFDPQQAKATDRVIITIKPKIVPPPPPVESITKINDTGVTSCGDYSRGHSGISNNDVVCQLLTDSNGDPVPSGQDGVSGRDITAPSDEDGRKGFSFTKIDSSGASLASSATQWSCVKDNVTGLVWELKTDDGGLHDKDDSFVWYESDPRVGYGGLPGYEKASDFDSTKNDQTCYGFSAGQAATYCNTKAFVNRINTNGLCGANNWRLPTRNELDSLVSYDLTPSIDPEYFPFTAPTYYWSSVPYAYKNMHVWTTSFQYGGGSPWEKYYNYAVRLVHN